MMLSRAVARAREISVRAAMARRAGNFVRQLLVESVLLSSLGGLLGLGSRCSACTRSTSRRRTSANPTGSSSRWTGARAGYFARRSRCFSELCSASCPHCAPRASISNTALKDDTPGAGSHRGGKLTAALVVLQFRSPSCCSGRRHDDAQFFAAQKRQSLRCRPSALTARLQLPDRKNDRYADAVVRRQFYENFCPSSHALPRRDATPRPTSSFPGSAPASATSRSRAPRRKSRAAPRASSFTQTAN